MAWKNQSIKDPEEEIATLPEKGDNVRVDQLS
jgi:hypothetical protein